MLKSDTNRVVVVVEIEIDSDGVECLREEYDGGGEILEYIDDMLDMDSTAKKIVEIRESNED